jgi:hypothetical protein
MVQPCQLHFNLEIIMKRINSLLLAGTMLLALGSCKKFVDINEVNPNSATYSTPDLVLPQALVYTASNSVAFNSYGAQIGGYMANAGGVSGWGSIITYDYTTTDFQGLWSSTYDNLEDYQYVLNNTAGSTEYAYYNAVAKIMKAYNFELLVNTYNDVPYYEAFKGTDNLQPKYDKAQDIYKELGVLLDSAIHIINTAAAQTNPNLQPKALIVGSTKADVVFNGSVNNWKRFANTIKLRLMLRGNGKVTFTTGINPTTFDPVGFITDDVLVQPGYTKIGGKQNPQWNSLAYSEANAVRGAGGNYVPTPFILSFYDGTKITDTGRGKVTFKSWSGVNGATTKTNRLGNLTNPATGETPNAWLIHGDGDASATNLANQGIYKGPDMAQPLMLGSQSYFLQAEAAVRGISGVTGDVKTLFENGIMASYRYLYKQANGEVKPGRDPNKTKNDFLTINATNSLVNLDLATSNDQKLEAIITQHYVSVNQILSHEGWYDFIRTGYPKIIANSNNARETFASVASRATTPNRLPTRVLYPVDEFRYNQNNVPKGINQFVDKIFFAL